MKYAVEMTPLTLMWKRHDRFMANAAPSHAFPTIAWTSLRLDHRGLENNEAVFHNSTARLRWFDKKGTFLMGANRGHFYFALTAQISPAET